jgi:hypothetical protein
MTDEITIEAILEPFTGYVKQKHTGTDGNPQRLMELLSLVQQANKAKKELGKMVDNATKQMAVEIRALRRIQERLLIDAGIISKAD